MTNKDCFGLCKLLVGDWRLQVEDCRLGVVDCGSQVAGCRLHSFFHLNRKIVGSFYGIFYLNFFNKVRFTRQHNKQIGRLNSKFEN